MVYLADKTLQRRLGALRLAVSLYGGDAGPKKGPVVPSVSRLFMYGSFHDEFRGYGMYQNYSRIHIYDKRRQ
jgi:hypothetical protein